MSGVRCQVSGVTIIIIFFFVDNVVELVGGESVINGTYPVKLLDQRRGGLDEDYQIFSVHTSPLNTPLPCLTF